MIVVIGATGNIGRHVVPQLVAAGEQVKVLTRDVQRAREVLGDGAELVAGDLADAAFVKQLLTGARAAVLTTPGSPDQPRLESAFLDAAAAAGVGHVVKTSVIGASQEHFVRYARWHAEVEQHAASLDISLSVLRPSWFAENFLGSAPTIADHGAMYGSAGAGRVGFVDSRDTAAVAVAVLTQDVPPGREHVITGPAALTFEQAAHELSEGLGRTVSYVDLLDDDLRAALLGASLPPEVADDILDINRNAREGGLAAETSTVQDLTGRPPRRLSEWARDNAAAFAPAAS